MKSVYLLLFFFLFNELSAQTFDVDTILISGDPSKHINFVILPDGYRQDELATFKTDAEKFVDVFFQTPPFNLYKSYFNVFIINVPSNESGADHPGTATDVTEPEHEVEDVDNYFGTTFDYYEIHRLLVPLEDGKIYGVLSDNFPAFDQVIILANTPHYGGSGGSFATASLHSASIEVTIHELGHSFAGLADEYYAGDFYAGERVNMTQETDPSKVKWKNWIGENEVGIYQHCCGGNSASWYRPHQNCKMRSLGAPFCPVCTEVIVERIHALAPPLLSFYPEEQQLSKKDLPLTFGLDLIHPDPSSLSVKWEFNEEEINVSDDSIVIEADMLDDGDNFLIAYIQDTIHLVRSDIHEQLHLYSVIWNIFNDGLGSHKVTGHQETIAIDFYPNPARDKLHISMKEKSGLKYSFELTDVSGRQLGHYNMNEDGILEIDVQNFSRGAYYLKIMSGHTLIAVKPIVLN